MIEQEEWKKRISGGQIMPIDQRTDVSFVGMRADKDEWDSTGKVIIVNAVLAQFDMANLPIKNCGVLRYQYKDHPPGAPVFEVIDGTRFWAFICKQSIEED